MTHTTGWLKTTHIYHLTVGKVRSQFQRGKVKVSTVAFLLGNPSLAFFQLLHVFPVGPRHSILHYHQFLLSLWLSLQGLSDYTGLTQMCVLSCFSRVRLFMTCSLPGSSVQGILPRQEYWSGCHTLLQGDLPDPGIKPASLMSPALGGGFFTTSTTWEAQIITQIIQHNLFNPHSVTPAKSFLSQKVTLTSSGHQNMDTFWGGNHHSAYLSFYCTANGQ